MNFCVVCQVLKVVLEKLHKLRNQVFYAINAQRFFGNCPWKRDFVTFSQQSFQFKYTLKLRNLWLSLHLNPIQKSVSKEQNIQLVSIEYNM